MAQNIIDKITSFVGDTFSGARDYNDQSIYRVDSNGLTGVARYLQKKDKTDDTGVTGVAKYLQAKQQIADASAATAAEEVAAAEITDAVSGVDKYMSRKDKGAAVVAKTEPQTQEPATGVARYIRGEKPHPESSATAETASAPLVPEVKKILSKVEQYLGNKNAAEASASESQVPEVKKILSKVEQYLAKHASDDEKTSREDLYASTKVKEPANDKPKSRVERYIADHDKESVAPRSKVDQYVRAHGQEVSKPQSRVAKYLSKQEAQVNAKSKVERYLADHDAEKSEPAKPKSRVEAYLAKQPEKKKLK